MFICAISDTKLENGKMSIYQSIIMSYLNVNHEAGFPIKILSTTSEAIPLEIILGTMFSRMWL